MEESIGKKRPDVAFFECFRRESAYYFNQGFMKPDIQNGLNNENTNSNKNDRLKSRVRAAQRWVIWIKCALHGVMKIYLT